MLHDIKSAIAIIKKEIPGGKIQSWIVYRDLYLFQVFTLNPLEEMYDPFYSVHRETGEFNEFSILTDGDIGEITTLFLAKK
jgi:hypothetical protein